MKTFSKSSVKVLAHYKHLPSAPSETVGVVRPVSSSSRRRAVADRRTAILRTGVSCMNRHVSSRLEMGARALEFSRAHPFDSPGYATALKQLEEQLAHAEQL